MSVTRLRCAKAAERLEVLSGVNNLAGTRHIVADGAPDHPWRGGADRFDAAFAGDVPDGDFHHPAKPGIYGF